MKAKKGLSSTVPTVISFASSITLGSTTIPVPTALLVFDPNASEASTTCQWTTVVPAACDNKEAFLTGVLYNVPSAITGGPNVTWSGTFTVPNGVELKWQWAAAVYTSSPGACTGLGVKPTDDNKCSAIKNSDKAGTPELIKASVIGGATGGGGSNFTSLSGTQSVECP